MQKSALLFVTKNELQVLFCALLTVKIVSSKESIEYKWEKVYRDVSLCSILYEAGYGGE